MIKTVVKGILIALLVGLFSCDQEEVTPSMGLSTSGYVGFWKEATGKEGAYDVEISRPSDYVFNLVGNGQIVASVEGGFIRNDTLIFDNGVHEYQFFTKLDTLIYSTKISTDVEKLVRIE